MVVADTLRTLCENGKGCGTRKGSIQGYVKRNVAATSTAAVVSSRFVMRQENINGKDGPPAVKDKTHYHPGDIAKKAAVGGAVIGIVAIIVRAIVVSAPYWAPVLAF